MTCIWSEISKFPIEFLETKQDEEFINKDLAKRKETRHFILGSCLPRGKQENILLYSELYGHVGKSKIKIYPGQSKITGRWKHVTE